MAEITCRWCSAKYLAHSENRNHCKRNSCRQKEIEENLTDLSKLVSLILRHKIEMDVEIRLPGNDTIGKQAKINSSGNIEMIIKKNGEAIDDPKNYIKKLISYFRSLLWKGIKGNFIIKTDNDGKIINIIPHETFVSIKDPFILGDNKLIYTIEQFKKQRRTN